VNATMRPNREIAIAGEVPAEKMDRDYCDASRRRAMRRAGRGAAGG